jgi:hypothetical protein
VWYNETSETKGNPMYIKMKVNECDFTGIKYSSPVDGVGCVARGATGRHCVVMTAGPEYVAKCGLVAMNYDDAVAAIDSRKNGDYADF